MGQLNSIKLFYFFLFNLIHFYFKYDDVDGRDPALSADADLRQLAMGGRRDPPPITANVRRFGFAEQIRHRFRRSTQVPLSGLHELQRGAVPQFPALLHRQSNGKSKRKKKKSSAAHRRSSIHRRKTPRGFVVTLIDRQTETERQKKGG